mmetsp:Transcript_5652/g.17410  ORF Transcript_5652/g.17410 Transcript_5652/m.17410 type:complete len:244 (+) Transcript_5652:2146-2877(+)
MRPANMTTNMSPQLLGAAGNQKGMATCTNLDRIPLLGCFSAAALPLRPSCTLKGDTTTTMARMKRMAIINTNISQGPEPFLVLFLRYELLPAAPVAPLAPEAGAELLALPTVGQGSEEPAPTAGHGSVRSAGSASLLVAALDWPDTPIAGQGSLLGSEVGGLPAPRAELPAAPRATACSATCRRLWSWPCKAWASATRSESAPAAWAPSSDVACQPCAWNTAFALSRCLDRAESSARYLWILL